ncbi:MAG: hypothetical protein ACU88J_07210 [Gammaproteobacteria bacterium]
MNFARPPFLVIPGQSAEDAAIDIVAAFKSIENLPNRVGRTYRAITGRLTTGLQSPLIVAGYSLAQAVDTEVFTGNNSYHNSQHYCEVMLSSYFLSLLAGMDDQITAEIVSAALIHDFHHDGKPNGDIPFRLERKAINEAKPYLIQAKVTQTQQQCLAALVLATEYLNGINIVHACYTHYTQGHALPEIPEAANELEALCNDPVKSKQALILCEADILPSIGLTFEHALQLQDKLSLEWGVRQRFEDKLQFIDHTCRVFIVGSFFNTNVAKLRLAMLHRIEKTV